MTLLRHLWPHDQGTESTRKRPRPFDALEGGHLLVDTESETAREGPSPGRGGSGLTSSHEMME